MTRWFLGLLSLALVASVASPAEAFTSKVKSSAISVSSTGIIEQLTLTTSVVSQGTGTPASLVFEGTANDFRDSGEAIKVEINTNVALNRLLIYTANLAGDASPQYCFDTGNNDPDVGPVGDGGGLVGVPTLANPLACRNTVPMQWALGVTGITATADPKVFNGTSTNVNYAFSPVAAPGVGASNAVFFTDRAHVLTFTNNGVLDNQDLVFCAGGGAIADARAQADGDGLYPQFFGTEGANSDLCDPLDLVNPVSQELSKNIAVVGFGFSGTTGSVPRLDTAATDDIVQVSSPLYLPIAGEFRYAPPGDYGTSTITIELVSQ